MKPQKIAIFASGSGSNAQKIIEHLATNDLIEIALILTNRPQAQVLERAAQFQIPSHVFDRPAFYHSEQVVQQLQKLGIDWLVLAGFLWLIPQNLIQAFPRRIINIHPSLLPKYGGKGMYGSHVHQAVHQAQEKETGITIHWVNEKYDEGEIIFQAKTNLEPEDSPEKIARKVQKLEHEHFPKVIEDLVMKSMKNA